MAWTWRLERADGSPVDAPGVVDPGRFASQSDAESWLGETWRDLLGAGVEQVMLLDGDRAAYSAPMPLTPG